MGMMAFLLDAYMAALTEMCLADNSSKSRKKISANQSKENLRKTGLSYLGVLSTEIAQIITMGLRWELLQSTHCSVKITGNCIQQEARIEMEDFIP
jgi:hypothetical protein